MLCLNTCKSANNGKCEDGSQLIRSGPPDRSNAHRSPWQQILCDLGTDCADCGPVAPHSHAMATLKQVMPSATVQDPPGLWAPTGLTGAALLASRSIEVRAAWTATQPSFIFPYTNPAEDFDVSRHMSGMRAVEPMYNLYWHRLSAECCARGGLMLDVGSNFGYYALLAAKMGCRVLAWEPVPVFRAFIELAAQLNNVSHLIHVRHAVVSDTAGKEVEIATLTLALTLTLTLALALALALALTLALP